MSTEEIQDPLWSLMLSTNDCFPGCSCDDDFFDICSERVKEWLKLNNLEKLQQSKKQLIELKVENMEEISRQTNVHFYSQEHFQAWINEWLEEIDEVLT